MHPLHFLMTTPIINNLTCCYNKPVGIQTPLSSFTGPIGLAEPKGNSYHDLALHWQYTSWDQDYFPDYFSQQVSRKSNQLQTVLPNLNKKRKIILEKSEKCFRKRKALIELPEHLLVNQSDDTCKRIFHYFLNNSVQPCKGRPRYKAKLLKEVLKPHFLYSVHTLFCFLRKEWDHWKLKLKIS